MSLLNSVFWALGCTELLYQIWATVCHTARLQVQVHELLAGTWKDVEMALNYWPSVLMWILCALDRHPIIFLSICHQAESNCVAQSRCAIQHPLQACFMLFLLNELSFAFSSFQSLSFFLSFSVSLSDAFITVLTHSLLSVAIVSFMWFFKLNIHSGLLDKHIFHSFLDPLYNVSNCIQYLKRFADVRFTDIKKKKMLDKVTSTQKDCCIIYRVTKSRTGFLDIYNLWLSTVQLLLLIQAH